MNLIELVFWGMFHEVVVDVEDVCIIDEKKVLVDGLAESDFATFCFLIQNQPISPMRIKSRLIPVSSSFTISCNEKKRTLSIKSLP